MRTPRSTSRMLLRRLGVHLLAARFQVSVISRPLAVTAGVVVLVRPAACRRRRASGGARAAISGTRRRGGGIALPGVGDRRPPPGRRVLRRSPPISTGSARFSTTAPQSCVSPPRNRSRRSRRHTHQKLLCRRALCDDLESGFGEQRATPSRTSTASSASTTRKGSPPAPLRPVPAGGLQTRSTPSSASTRSARPRSPEPLVEVRSADAVVDDLHHQLPVLADDFDARPRRTGVLRDVGQRFGHEVVAATSTGAGRRCSTSTDQVYGTGRSRRQRLKAHGEAVVAEHRRVDSLGQLPELLHRRRQVLSRGGPGAAPSSESGLRLRGRPAPVQRERDQPLLRAVVEIALEPPALGVARLHDPGARALQLFQPRPQLDLQPPVLERDRCRRCDGFEHSGSSSSAGSGDDAATCAPPRSISVVDRPAPSSDSTTGWPSTLAQLSNSGNQYTRSSDGSLQRRESASRSSAGPEVRAQLDDAESPRRNAPGGRSGARSRTRSGRARGPRTSPAEYPPPQTPGGISR